MIRQGSWEKKGPLRIQITAPLNTDPDPGSPAVATGFDHRCYMLDPVAQTTVGRGSHGRRADHHDGDGHDLALGGWGLHRTYDG